MTEFIIEELKLHLDSDVVCKVLTKAIVKDEASIIVPEGVEQISSFAFKDCESLREITLPVSIQKIEDNAFPKNDSFVINYLGNNEGWYKVKRGIDLQFDKNNPYTINFLGADETSKHKQYRYVEKINNNSESAKVGESYKILQDPLISNELRQALLFDDDLDYICRNNYFQSIDKMFIQTKSGDILPIYYKDSESQNNLHDYSTFFCYQKNNVEFDPFKIVHAVHESANGRLCKDAYVEEVKCFCKDHGIDFSDIDVLIEEHALSGTGDGKRQFKEAFEKVLNPLSIKPGCNIPETAKLYDVSEQAIYSYLYYLERGKPHFFEYRIIHSIANETPYLDDFLLLHSHTDKRHMFKETKGTISLNSERKIEKPFVLTKEDFKVGSEIHFGSNTLHPLSWTVLSNDGKTSMLLLTHSFCCAAIEYYEGASDFLSCIDCGAISTLNDDEKFWKSFSKAELSVIKDCNYDWSGRRTEILPNIEEEDKMNSKVFFLTKDEFEIYKNIIPNIDKDWWLGTLDEKYMQEKEYYNSIGSCVAYTVDKNGALCSDDVRIENGVRPVIIIDLSEID